ncbi:hypothetical protein niasHS_016683 [Heterodera schachtii]|uniref:Uncharacterized protein n=1 Tax=Heterodera schachtii TaxID=97005 RepID=A0ABD2HSX8_HETSC
MSRPTSRRCQRCTLTIWRGSTPKLKKCKQMIGKEAYCDLRRKPILNCTANSTKCCLKPFRVPSTCELLAMRWTETPQNFENLLNGLLRAAEDAYMTAVHGKPGPNCSVSVKIAWQMLPLLHNFLATIQAITPPPRYIVVNQSEEDALRFNRAALINIGALEAERVGCDYMAIHDVDMVKAHFGATAMDAALAQL